MKMLHLSSASINGGAAKSAQRLNRGLQKMGVDSQILMGRISQDPTIISPRTKLEKALANIRPTLDAIPLRLYRQSDSNTYSIQWLPERILAKVARIDPDIIHLHWICGGFLKIETIAKFERPIIWTLHDSWAFTGGCHIPYDCKQYTNSCGACPQLHSKTDWDLSRWIWQRKAKAWQNLNLTIVTPSQWLARCAASSSLFRNLRVEVIPNGIDITRYKPVESNLARKLLNLPQDKQLILFGAISATSDRNKGFYLLQSALQYLSQSEGKDNLEIVIFGACEPINPLNLGFKAHYLGRLNDDISLVLSYSAADVMIVPSIQENLPNTVMEALACGTPCVAFNIGGMPDMIEPQQNGYLAQPFEIEDLARGIAWVLNNKQRWWSLSSRAREKIEQEFSLETQASKYLQLYIDVLKGCGIS